jgi:hypothetical protein
MPSSAMFMEFELLLAVASAPPPRKRVHEPLVPAGVHAPEPVGGRGETHGHGAIHRAHDAPCTVGGQAMAGQVGREPPRDVVDLGVMAHRARLKIIVEQRVPGVGFGCSVASEIEVANTFVNIL